MAINVSSSDEKECNMLDITHTPVKQLFHWQDLSFQWTFKTSPCSQPFNCSSIPSHVFLPWLVTKKIYSQSSPKSSLWWRIFAKLLKLLYWAAERTHHWVKAVYMYIKYCDINWKCTHTHMVVTVNKLQFIQLIFVWEVF